MARMKRALLASVTGFAIICSLSACASGAYDEAPAAQAGPKITNPQTEDLYRGSGEDDNGISHWVFNQKLPNGKTVVCVAALRYGSDSIAISCLPGEEAE